MKDIRLDLLGLAAAVLVGIGLAYFFIGRSLREWQAQRKELAELTMQVDALTQLSTAMQNAKAALGQANAQEVLAGRVPRDVEFETFFQQLQTQAAERGASIQRVQHEDVVTQGDLNSLPINLTLLGPLEALYQFLGDMRNSKRLVKLEQVALLATEDPGACELQLHMRIYSAATPAAEAPAS